MVYNEVCFDFVTSGEGENAMTQTEQVYGFIHTYIQQVGYPPHIREVAAHCSLSLTQVLLCLVRLEAAGKLTFRLNRPRGMRLTYE
jgi:hypothetical protein